jgi:hypothetical protein
MLLVGSPANYIHEVRPPQWDLSLGDALRIVARGADKEDVVAA